MSRAKSSPVSALVSGAMPGRVRSRAAGGAGPSATALSEQQARPKQGRQPKRPAAAPAPLLFASEDMAVRRTAANPAALGETRRGRAGTGGTDTGSKMTRLVMKFGGTSVADLDRIRASARHVAREWHAGHEVAVVVSAMAGETNRLVSLTQEAGGSRDMREYDMIVSTGEQVSCGLMAMVLQEMGVTARSWAAWQVPIRTTGTHGRARITGIESRVLDESMGRREVAVVAGFQGLSPDNRVTTLGRGGSDTSAVALAAALNCDRCDIYTDVDGVYTTDPRIVPKARKIERISYEEMLEMASLGAKVLQTRSVELAMVHRVPLRVLLSFADPEAPTPGTLVCDEVDIVEQQVVSGIAYTRDEAKVTLVNVSDQPGVAGGIFGALAEAEINVDMIVQNISEGGTTDMTFTVPEIDLDRTIGVIEKSRDRLGYDRLVKDPNVAKISVIGIGMRSHAGVANRMFKALGEKGINIQVISTSEIKISVLVDREYTELAVRALHSAYGLDAN
jgi:aspartate kinase